MTLDVATESGRAVLDQLFATADVFVTNVASTTASGAPGSESVALSFAKVAFEYKPFKNDGSLGQGVHFKYDVNAQKEG